MSKLKITTYELRDVAIMQAPVSFCNHRGDVDNKVTICGRNVYPIFVAPMASVTDEKNYKVWIENGLTPVVPRSVMQTLSFDERMKIAKETFVSISLKEAQNNFIAWASDANNFMPFEEKLYICIDIAHGTLSELYEICKVIKNAFADGVELMTGNVANLDDVYKFYADAGIDWMRASVGSGSRCTTSANGGPHVGMATLLDKLYESKKAYMHSHNGNAPTKIIADGGIDNFDAINKSIALGADAVMIGKLIAETEEACGEIYNAHMECDYNNFLDVVNKLLEHWGFSYKVPEYLYKTHRVRNYFGMSTKKGQELCSADGKATKTSEGISRPVEVKYPVAKWVDNMQSYLRSAMTYTNSRTIKEMQENAQMVILGGSGDAAYRK